MSPNSTVIGDRPVPLSRIDVGETVTIREVRTAAGDPLGADVGLRLLELGFVVGESLRVVAQGHPGREPLAVRIGNTTFALRRFEADYVLVVKAERSGSKP